MKIENKLKGKTAYDCMVYGSFIDVDEQIDEQLDKAMPDVAKMVEIIGELTDDSISTIISFMLQYYGARHVYDLVNRYISELDSDKAESVDAEVVDANDYKEITSKAVYKSETNLLVSDTTVSSRKKTDKLFDYFLSRFSEYVREQIIKLNSYKTMYELTNVLIDFIKTNKINNFIEVKDPNKISSLIKNLCTVAGFNSKNKMYKALKLSKKASLEKIFTTLYKNIIINDSELNKLLCSNDIKIILSEIEEIINGDYHIDYSSETDEELEDKINFIRSRVKTTGKDRSKKYIDAVYYIINSGNVESFISQKFGVLLKDISTPQYIELDVPEYKKQQGFDICLHTNINPNTDLRIVADSSIPLYFDFGCCTGSHISYELVPKYEENQKAS